MTLTFRGGRLPAQPTRAALQAGPALAALPAPPASSDWLTPVPAADWGMLGNDEWGDCTCAGVGHKRIGDVYVNQQHQVLAVTTADALALYSAVTGFDPNAGPSGDNPTDQGAVCQDVLQYWQKSGFLGEKIVAFAKVDLSNLTAVKQAIATFGQVYTGFNFPSSAMDQFNNHQAWDVVKGASIEGGHCVTIGAYDATGLECVTWGAVQKMTWAFFQKYFDEAWVIVTPDFVSAATGNDVLGASLYQLGQDYAALTGKPNPIPAPAPQPQPTPSPTPTPTPAPASADATFAAAAHTWLTAKGL
ncbi:hypothetical protein [Kitasatospora sp. NBC_01302]|uniref:hypothetical protein n=1 Tax=Kitasatospora sp. NBC_01302 TaxID=2903575 RepID=UPI002E12D4E3|nr:hypothetical protein OG294_14455 [Kitasatospora sp. NBC_01302]